MDTNTQIERLIELAIVQRTELKRLVEELPQLKEHLSAEIERTFEETEPQLRAELEEWTSKQAADKTAALGVALESKIASLAKSLEESAQAKFSAVLAARDQNADLLKQAEERIALAASEIPGKVKEIVTAELARFPRAGEIDQLRKEFAEPRGLNPRGKWLPDQTYNKLDLVTWNGDSYVSNTDGNKERPGRNAENWTLSAARGTSGGGPADLSALTAVPSNGELLIGSGTSWVNGTLSAGAGISITVGPGAITISATDGDITLDDGTAASPSLHFTNDPDTGIYRPAANTLGISVSGTQIAYFDANGITTVGAGATFDGSVHAANGNANNPSLSFTSDDNTGFFRHQPDEIGISLGGTQKATLTSTTFSITPNLSTSGNLTVSGTATIASNFTISSVGFYAGGGIPGAGRLLYSSIAGTMLCGQTGSTYDLSLANAGGTTIIGVPTGTNNTTLAGNLTVSGTGGISIGSATFSGGRALTATTGGGNSVSARLLQSGVADWEIKNEATTGALSFAQSTINYARLTATGNFLLGTTTDSGNGKLQLATHTTSAGGIGFGTDTSAFATSAGFLAVRGIGNNQSGVFEFQYTSGAGTPVTGAGYVGVAGSAGTLATGTAIGDVVLRGAGAVKVASGGGTIALTLDSSQNATFVGGAVTLGDYAGDQDVIIAAQSTGVGYLRWRPTASGTNAYGFSIAYDNPNTKLSFLRHEFSTAGTEWLSVARATGVATFANAIAIGNTVQTAASIASTHKVTISIGGVTYYLLATNV